MKRKFKKIIYIVCAFSLPLIILSSVLIKKGVTDRKLWNGSEPNITSILKGSNIESYGRWNVEDADFINSFLYDRELLEYMSKEKVLDRYRQLNLLELINFFTVKFTKQWTSGDCGGAFWAQLNLSEDKVKIDINNKGNIMIQGFYSILLLLMFIGLFKRKYINNNIINLFFIILCGYGAVFLILESQERYSFIINWIFIIFAVTGVKSKKVISSSY